MYLNLKAVFMAFALLIFFARNQIALAFIPGGQDKQEEQDDDVRLPVFVKLEAMFNDTHGAMVGFSHPHKSIMWDAAYKIVTVSPTLLTRMLEAFDYSGCMHGFTEEHKVEIAQALEKTNKHASFTFLRLFEFFSNKGCMGGFSEEHKVEIFKSIARSMHRVKYFKLCLESFDTRARFHCFSEEHKMAFLRTVINAYGEEDLNYFLRAMFFIEKKLHRSHYSTWSELRVVEENLFELFKVLWFHKEQIERFPSEHDEWMFMFSVYSGLSQDYIDYLESLD